MDEDWGGKGEQEGSRKIFPGLNGFSPGLLSPLQFLCMSSHNSVCYNQMYVCIEYLWTLKAGYGYLRTQLCIKGAYAGVGEATVVISVAYCELSWVCLGWYLDISLHPFRLDHPSCSWLTSYLTILIILFCPLQPLPLVFISSYVVGNRLAK